MPIVHNADNYNFRSARADYDDADASELQKRYAAEQKPIKTRNVYSLTDGNSVL